MPPIVMKPTLYWVTLTFNINAQGNIQLHFFGTNVMKTGTMTENNAGI